MVTSQEHSRAWYRIGATRAFSGSKKTQPQLSVKLKEVRLQNHNILKEGMMDWQQQSWRRSKVNILTHCYHKILEWPSERT